MILVGVIILGGLKRIAQVSQIIVPFMAVIYLVFTVLLLICNISEIPAAIALIVKAAFAPKAVAGGAIGTMFIAMQKGVARGIFSNEAGLGSAPIAAAAVKKGLCGFGRDHLKIKAFRIARLFLVVI